MMVKRLLMAALATAILAVPSRADLANHIWSGTTKAAFKGIFALLGEQPTGKGKLVVPASEDPVGLTTTATGWTLSGGSFGTLSGVFATTAPGKIYTGSIAASDVNTWVDDRLAATFAGVTNVSATGFASFRPSKDGSHTSVVVIITFTANLNTGAYLAAGIVKINIKMGPT